MPRDLDALPWGDLDFLGGREPSPPPDRANLVTEHAGRLVGVPLRHPFRRRGLLQRSPLRVAGPWSLKGRTCGPAAVTRHTGGLGGTTGLRGYWAGILSIPGVTLTAFVSRWAFWMGMGVRVTKVGRPGVPFCVPGSRLPAELVRRLSLSSYGRAPACPSAPRSSPPARPRSVCAPRP
ncbi:FBP domain-containing protein [Streptomyces violascens]|uniref:FBP domain-containing protein n=1 Tax=Streptomyces violascens TaxID=67381 RepID=UPI0036CDAD5E